MSDDAFFDFTRELFAPDVSRFWNAAAELYSNQGLRMLAAAVVYQNDRGLEYLRTAPVIIIGMLPHGKSYGSTLRRMGATYKRASEFAQVAGMYRRRVESGPKLRDLMASYKLAKPLRAISGKALSPNKARALHMMTQFVKPSVIAQAVPERSFAQHLWLYAVDDFVRRAIIIQDNEEVSRLLTWATANLNRFTQQEQMHVVGDLVDFIFRRRSRFNEKWTFDQAHEAMLRWHDELGRMTNAQRFAESHGVDYDSVVAAAGLPGKDEIFGEFVFVPVNSGAKLHEEGRAMRHCVSSYTGAVLKRSYAVYSIRDGKGNRRATFGLRAQDGWWISDQIKGHCNRQVGNDVRAACEEFMVRYRKYRKVQQ